MIGSSQLRNWLEAGLQIVFPATCPACGEEVSRANHWCAACIDRVWHPGNLALTEREMVHVRSCRALTRYDGSVRDLLQRLKFEQQRLAAGPLSWLISLADEQELDGLPLQDGVIVPVPLSSERFTERGYNQVELLFAKWARSQACNWAPEALARKRHTVPQWSLDRRRRADNLRNAFSCQHPSQIYGRAVLLVDDIVTTGHTLEECAAILLESGASSVDALCLAHGHDPDCESAVTGGNL